MPFQASDVIASAAVNGDANVIACDFATFNDNGSKGSKGKKKDPSVVFLKLKFRTADGKLIPFDMQFSHVITCSQPKCPYNTDEDTCKYMQAGFMAITEEDARRGDYAPRTFEDPDQQETENTVAAEMSRKIYINTNQFMRVLEILQASLTAIANRILDEADSVPFPIEKVLDLGNVKVRRILQISGVKDGETVEFDQPYGRVRYHINPDNRQLEAKQWNKSTGTYVFAPNVYDSRSIIEDPTNPKLATLFDKETGEEQYLNTHNAIEFITRWSRLSGYIKLDSMSLSKQGGISQDLYFNKLYVARHSPSGEYNETKAELLEMCGDGRHLVESLSDTISDFA